MLFWRRIMYTSIGQLVPGRTSRTEAAGRGATGEAAGAVTRAERRATA
jgi:hypothetical protein